MQNDLIKRSDIIWLGVSSAVTGALVGGLLLGLGLALAGDGQPIGLLFILPAAPIAGGAGLWLATRQAKRFG
jgi:hypothetical protein